MNAPVINLKTEYDDHGNAHLSGDALPQLVELVKYWYEAEFKTPATADVISFSIENINRLIKECWQQSPSCQSLTMEGYAHGVKLNFNSPVRKVKMNKKGVY